VVIYRSPLEGLSSLKPARSFCPHCRAAIAWRDNIPVLSWLLLGRRCRACRAPISARYPLVELGMALLFAFAAWWFPPVDGASVLRLLVAFYLVATCVVVTFIDLEHQIIPDTITWPGMALGVLASLILPELHAGHVGFRADAPAQLGAARFDAGAGRRSRQPRRRRPARQPVHAPQDGRRGLAGQHGLGRREVDGLAGAFLGVSSVFGAILIGCFAGALVGLLMFPLARLRGQDAPVGLPFGPFLALGMLCELFAPGLAWSLLGRLTGAA
jgi:leader peptidase (prepilin peptidase)/N-methyltransferase